MSVTALVSIGSGQGFLKICMFRHQRRKSGMERWNDDTENMVRQPWFEMQSVFPSACSPYSWLFAVEFRNLSYSILHQTNLLKTQGAFSWISGICNGMCDVLYIHPVCSICVWQFCLDLTCLMREDFEILDHSACGMHFHNLINFNKKFWRSFNMKGHLCDLFRLCVYVTIPYPGQAMLVPLSDACPVLLLLWPNREHDVICRVDMTSSSVSTYFVSDLLKEHP